MSKLFFASFLMLFAETMCIRWLGVEIPVFRAFPNLILMVTFIGASFGIAQPENKLNKIWLVLSLIVLLAAVLIVPLSPLKDLSLRTDNGSGPLSAILAMLFIMLDCLSLLVVFRAIGSTIGQSFKDLPPLPAYSVNILGSMLGVLCFAAISFLGGPPWVWLLAASAAMAAYIEPRVPLLSIMIPAVVLSYFVTGNSYWSPYGKLDIHTFDVPSGSIYGSGNYMLYSNNVYFHLATHAPRDQEIQTLKNKKLDSQEQILFLNSINMELPYKLARSTDDMLILGAGSGNDAAFALNKPVKRIDAVEIDPVIGTFGAKVHPDKPYLDRRVHVIINDARAYLHDTKRRYDLIDFSCLDPGGTLNTSSFLRVDNFVYTKECITDTLKCLKPDGIVAMSFATGPDNPITARLYNTIMAATGKPPFALCGKTFDSCLFIFGPGIDNHPEAIQNASASFADLLQLDSGSARWQPNAEQAKERPSSDDWPFLYLQFNSMGLLIYSIVLGICVLTPVLLLLRGSKDLLANPEAFSMFFLGEAFMLMETKSCTELSLVWGNTWIVSSVVIFTVLLLGFLGNAYVLKHENKGHLRLIYFLITASLLLDFGLQISNSLPSGIDKIVSPLIVCLPVLFGGILFSRLLGRAKQPNICFAANMLGVTFGGLLENACVVFGIKSLSLLALLLYLCSAIPLIIKARSTKSS
ncbi:MAG: hypothetical protein KGS72_12770 [Cyanobacteria bacterium REEB67]|nr:hypothetical protein [Cyanobacteria bacterium REEB67]